MRVYCIGDSLVFGYGVSAAQRWTTLLAQRTGWEVVNCGLCGDTTGGMLARLHAQILPEIRKIGGQDSCVLLLGGCNDIFYSGTDTGARSNMGAMSMALRDYGIPAVIIVPPRILPKTDRMGQNDVIDMHRAQQLLDGYDDWLTGYGRQFEFPTVDLRRIDSEGEIWLPDGLHPNASGHVRIVKSLERELSVLFSPHIGSKNAEGREE